MSNRQNPSPKTGASKPETARGYQVGDEISFASAQGMMYGTVIKLINDPSSPAVEIEFEDGRKEIKKVKDRALHLVRRATGRSEIDEMRGKRKWSRDQDIEDVRRSDQRRGGRH
ncbi:MAG: hypothetical protein JNN15_14960 [Blastocatellia bacterium]|nr:hypothetical protein [Blastocatellia bacterium]